MHGTERRHGVAGPIYSPCRRYAGYADSFFRHKGSTLVGGAVCGAEMQDAANSRHRSVIQMGGIINCVQDVGIPAAARV